MTDFLPAIQNNQIQLNEFITERDGESHCYACGSKSSGRISKCEHRHDYVSLQKMTRNEYGALLPHTDYKGEICISRYKKSDLAKEITNLESLNVHDVVFFRSQWWLVQKIENAECGSTSHRWSLESLYDEQQRFIALKNMIYLNDDFTPSTIDIETISKYRHLVSKDDLLKVMVTVVEDQARKIERLIEVSSELARRVEGAGSSLMGGY